MTIGERLKAERERLDLSQEKLRDAAGVSKNTQINYEKDARSPDADYLAAVAAAGVDVLYVVTGQRTPPGDGGVLLSADEADLIAMYRACTPRDRSLTRQVVQGYQAMSADQQALARRVMGAMVDVTGA